MNSNERPLSPHLQVYRPQLTSVMSFSHRATGILLSLGLIALTYWILAAAAGPDTFNWAQGLFGSWIGRVLLFFWSFAVFYHLCNGIRHLVWDTGHALDLDSTYTGGYLTVLGAVVLTILTWIVVVVA